jgi:AraC-like DNA-binding protein
MGCPPRYFADAARVRYAIAALGDPTVQIADIADSLGFSAPGHFTTFFSQHMGVAPGVYRRHLLHLAD